MFIVYETKNLINGKTYIGVHNTKTDAFDGYLGSGKSLKVAISKYGRENFSRTTLFTFTNDLEAYKKESELVTEHWCKQSTNYNMHVGGNKPPKVSWLGRKHRPEVIVKISKSRKGLHAGKEHWTKQPGSEDGIQKISDAAKKRKGLKNAAGHILKPESKKMMVEKLQKYRWYCNPEKTQEVFSLSCPDNWVAGRKSCNT